MSYTRNGITVVCASDPESNYAQYYSDIERKIISDGYTPKTSMENLISMIILHFDCDDNYGEYDEETGCGGYGDEFTLEECFRYVSETGGYGEVDYEKFKENVKYYRKDYTLKVKDLLLNGSLKNDKLYIV